MKNTIRQNRLLSTALLASLITLGSAPSFAADGSERLKLKSAPVASKLQRLAEDGSDRLRQRQQRSDNQSHEDAQLAEDGGERSRHYWLERKLDVAEGGADRLLAARKA